MMFKCIVSISINYKSSCKAYTVTCNILPISKSFSRNIFKYIELLTSINKKDNFGVV
jgi:hypothetical protein